VDTLETEEEEEEISVNKEEIITIMVERVLEKEDHKDLFMMLDMKKEKDKIEKEDIEVITSKDKKDKEKKDKKDKKDKVKIDQEPVYINF
jgi:hypothetical protein